MQTLDHDEVSGHVDADPMTLYRLVADVTRHPGLSPEVESVRWLDGATEAVPGARFEAVNRAGSRGRSWRNRPVVEVADPGREVAWSRTEPFSGTVLWRWRFEPEGDGTRVTESYEVVRPLHRIGWFVIERVFGSPDRRTDLRRGMEESLRRLAALAASGAAAS